VGTLSSLFTHTRFEPARCFVPEAAGLKRTGLGGMQAIESTGPRDETRLALAEAVKLTLANISWRHNACRVVLLVADASPVDDAPTFTPEEVRERESPCASFSPAVWEV
jgi:hypothetical protein